MGERCYPSTQVSTMANPAKRKRAGAKSKAAKLQRVLKPESDESDEETDYTAIQFSQELLAGLDPALKEWAEAITERSNKYSGTIQKLAKERAQRKYYRRYGDHCLKLRKYATAKALKTDFQTSTQFLWEERQAAPKSFWKEPKHKALAKFIREEYGMTKKQWESMCEFIQRRNNWAHDGRFVNDDILAADLSKLEKDYAFEEQGSRSGR